jgi:hypothetical protein
MVRHLNAALIAQQLQLRRGIGNNHQQDFHSLRTAQEMTQGTGFRVGSLYAAAL